MKIIGCDYHPSWQQIAWVDTETGEMGERKLMHADGEAERFYRELAAPALLGMEATGNSNWFVDLVAEMGHQVLIGDAAAIRAKQVRKQKTDRRDAAHILDLVLKNDFPKIWTPSIAQRDQRQLLIHRWGLVRLRARAKNELQHLAMNKGVQKKARLWSKTGQKLLRELPLQYWAGQRRGSVVVVLCHFCAERPGFVLPLEKAAPRSGKAPLFYSQPGRVPLPPPSFFPPLAVPPPPP